MKLKSIVLILLFGLLSAASAKDRRREEMELEMKKTEALKKLDFLKLELEKVRAGRWQDKRNAVAAQKAFDDTWKDLKREVDRLTAQKARTDESLLRWKNQKNEKKEAVEGMEVRYKGFRAQLKEKIDALENKTLSSFQHDNQAHLDELARARLDLQGSGVGGVTSAIDGIFDVWKKRYLIGESRSFERGKFTVSSVHEVKKAGLNLSEAESKNLGAKVAAGYFIRIGAFFKAFVSTESEDVALLVKTGRLDKRAWQWIENIHDDTRSEMRQALTAILAGTPSDSGQAVALAHLPMDVQLVNATGEGYTTGSGATALTHAKKEFSQGGWVMYPISFVLLLGLLVVLERSFLFLRKDQNAAALMKKVLAHVRENRIPEALSLVKNRKKAVSRVIGTILDNAGRGRLHAEEQAYEAMLQETPRLETRISTINILAAASPLVGLLGTVSGMVTLFGVITVHGTSDPKLMAGGISEALIATKWGLGVAVPMLLFYNLMDLWSSKIVSNMEKYSTQLINDLYISDGAGKTGTLSGEQETLQPVT